MRRDAVTLAAGLCSAATLLALSGTPRAVAQNALGDGHVLDANLRQDSGGYNQAPANFRSELEIRNAIVTGNAPGGFSFRGTVGYTAADDFRGALGSNDIFAYQRDSFYSGLATRNLAGLSALQTPLVYSVAGQSAGFFGGPLIIDRSGAHASVGDSITSTDATAPGPVRTDMYGSIAGSMRTPSLQVLRMAEQAETIAISQGATEGNRIVVSASPLLGIKALPTSSLVIDTGARYEEPTTIDLTTPKQPEVGAETEAPASQTLGMSVPISPHQKILSALASEQSVAPMPEGTPLQPSAALQPTTQPEAQPETQPQTQPGPETTQPEQPTGAPPEGQTPPGETPGTTIPGLEELRNLINSTPGAPTPTPEPPDTGTGTGTSNADQSTQTGRPGASNVATLARQVLGQIEIPEIDHLATRATSQGVYFEHMRKGEQLLAEARWFEAEERFTAALAIIPGNALAAAGRVHAQIGAGMYLSAAVNLRNLFRAYPEFIPVRFSEQLLPRGDRLATIEAQLRQRAERDTSIARDAALLMAYLGHQYDDRALVEEGFRTLDRVETNLALEPDPLDEALRAVWLEGKE